MVRGSCLCGAFHFEINGRISDIHRCHCSICRKATGAGAILATSVRSFRWVRGEDTIRTYGRPSGWTTAFCPTCGTPATRLHESGNIWSIPAGCLDDDPGTKVAEHIFVGSIASGDHVSPGAELHDEWGPGRIPHRSNDFSIGLGTNEDGQRVMDALGQPLPRGQRKAEV